MWKVNPLRRTERYVESKPILEDRKVCGKYAQCGGQKGMWKAYKLVADRQEVNDKSPPKHV